MASYTIHLIYTIHCVPSYETHPCFSSAGGSFDVKGLSSDDDSRAVGRCIQFAQHQNRIIGTTKALEEICADKVLSAKMLSFHKKCSIKYRCLICPNLIVMRHV